MSFPQSASTEGVGATELRTAMSHFATGVAVLTAVDAQGAPFGTTANAVSSVSLDPPLVLACLREESETLAALLDHGGLCVNVLREDQREVAERFAGPAAPETWTGVAHRRSPTVGVPVLDGSLATLECVLHEVADGGDHRIVIGRVIAVDHSVEPGAPLVFFQGSFGMPSVEQALPAPAVEEEPDVEEEPAVEVALARWSSDGCD